MYKQSEIFSQNWKSGTCLLYIKLENSKISIFALRFIRDACCVRYRKNSADRALPGLISSHPPKSSFFELNFVFQKNLKILLNNFCGVIKIYIERCCGLDKEEKPTRRFLEFFSFSNFVNLKSYEFQTQMSSI